MMELSFKNRVYQIEPKFELISEIEDELGSAPELLNRLLGDKWKVSELVTVVHILLHYAGRNIDYIDLGNQIIAEGIDKYLLSVKEFLRFVVSSK